MPSPHPKAKRRPDESASDLDFAQGDNNTDGDEWSDPGEGIDPQELESGQDRSKGTRKKVQKRPTPQKSVSVAKSATPAKQVTKVKYTTPNTKNAKSKLQAPQAKQNGVGKLPPSSAKASTAAKSSSKPYVASKPPNGSAKILAGIDKAQDPDGKSSIKRSTISKTPVATQGIQNQKNSAKTSTAGSNAKIVKMQVSTAYPVTGKQVQAVHAPMQETAVAKQNHVKHPPHANSSIQQTTRQNLPLTIVNSSTDMATHIHNTHPSHQKTPVKESRGQPYTLPRSLPNHNPRGNTQTETSSPLEPPTTKHIRIKLLSSRSNPETSQGYNTNLDSPSSKVAQLNPILKLTMADPSRDQPSTWMAPKTGPSSLPATLQANPSPAMEVSHSQSADTRSAKKRKVTAGQSR